MWQKMLQVGSGGNSDVNKLKIENATFIGGYYQIETSSAADPYYMDTSGNTSHLSVPYSSEYLSMPSFWNVTINKSCKVLYMKYGQNGLSAEYVECVGGETFKGNYGGIGKIMILVFV